MVLLGLDYSLSSDASSVRDMCIFASGHVRADPSSYDLSYFVSMWLNRTCIWYKGQANTQNDPSAILCFVNKEIVNYDFPS